MLETYTLRRPDGTTVTLEAIDRTDWTGVDDPCPDCGGTEFNQYSTEGRHIGHQNSVPIMRTDYGAASTPLATRCRTCRTLLHKHPLVDTLAQLPIGED
ncbi:MAG: putative RNA-binding Zn-ribbon protein involved in translation (DUF1610 family) [Haloarculaceae archaeon]|jgi:predicted RNA-binding Zn-ribbon protein involved in translation (DUF1610 family)